MDEACYNMKYWQIQSDKFQHNLHFIKFLMEFSYWQLMSYGNSCCKVFCIREFRVTSFHLFMELNYICIFHFMIILGDKISNLFIWQLSSHGNNFLLGVMFTKVYNQRAKSWWFINSHGIYIKMFYWCLFEWRVS